MKPTDQWFPPFHVADGADARTVISAMAMQGILANPEAQSEPSQVTKYAIECADALLARLAETKQ